MILFHDMKKKEFKKKRKILIIGNGFDIAHGLPTRYTDFMIFVNTYRDIYEKSTQELMLYERITTLWMTTENSHFKESIQMIRDLIISDYQKRKVINEVVTIKSENDELFQAAKDNIWLNYFSRLLESEAGRTDFFEKLFLKNKKKRTGRWIDFEAEMSLIIQLLETENKPTVVSFEKVQLNLPKNTSEELAEKINCFNKVIDVANEKELINKLKNDLENMRNLLSFYLREFVEKSTPKKLSIIERINPDHVISFNYTDTCERIYNFQNVHYIHGECKKNNIVLGIDECLKGEEKDTKTDCLDFKKFFQRVHFETDTTYRKIISEMRKRRKPIRVPLKFRKQLEFELYLAGKEPRLLDFFEEEELSETLEIPEPLITEIFVFGHSLDKTDKEILRAFFYPIYTKVLTYAHEEKKRVELERNMVTLIGQEQFKKKAGLMPSFLQFELQN